FMRISRWPVLGVATAVVACVSMRGGAGGAGTDIRTPLGADLTPDAKTGAQVPLRVDPNAKVILSGASGLPAASFLPSQADRGARVYQATCGTCHEPGELIGQSFV